MHIELFFRIIFFVLFILILGIRVFYREKTQGEDESTWAVKVDAAKREGKWSVLLRLFLFFSMFVIVILYAVNPIWLDLFAAPLPTWSRWLGLVLSVFSILLFTWVHHTLGVQWSVNLQLRDGLKFITCGPYRRIRHPMYTALFGLSVGLALISTHWLVVLLAVVFWFFICTRIGKEEKMMIERFGDEYRDYMRRTGRFLPSLVRKTDKTEVLD